jgi:hypothetical protein
VVATRGRAEKVSVDLLLDVPALMLDATILLAHWLILSLFVSHKN